MRETHAQRDTVPGRRLRGFAEIDGNEDPFQRNHAQKTTKMLARMADLPLGAELIGEIVEISRRDVD